VGTGGIGEKLVELAGITGGVDEALFVRHPTKRDLDENKGKNATNRGNICPIPATCFDKHQFVRP